MVSRENSTDRHSEILWVHPTQRGAVLDVWKGLDPQHLKKKDQISRCKIDPWGQGGFLATGLAQVQPCTSQVGSRFKILREAVPRSSSKFWNPFFLIWEIWLSPEAFQNGMPIILDEPAYFLVHPIFWWIQFFLKKNFTFFLKFEILDLVVFSYNPILSRFQSKPYS